MVCFILAVIVGAGQSQQQTPLFQKMFPSPTGQNALEYYVQASDVADRVGAHIWTIPLFEDPETVHDMFAETEQLARLTHPVVELVRQGNRFPIREPVGGLSSTALIAIKKVARLVRQYARVEFARGKPDSGTDALLLTIELAGKLDRLGGIVQAMTAPVIGLSALRDFSRLYTSISLNGAGDILRRVPAPAGLRLGDHWRQEARLVKEALDDPSLSGRTAFVRHGLDKMSDRDLRTAKQQWQELADLIESELSEFTLETETSWMKMASRLKQYGDQVPAPISEMVDLSSLETLVYRQVRYRTTLRLLRAHAHIAMHRWKEGLLPSSLEELPVDAMFDIGSGQPFVYVRTTDSGYDLYSQGNGWHGQIRLRNSTNDMPKVDPDPPAVHDAMAALLCLN